MKYNKVVPCVCDTPRTMNINGLNYIYFPAHDEFKYRIYVEFMHVS